MSFFDKYNTETKKKWFKRIVPLRCFFLSNFRIVRLTWQTQVSWKHGRDMMETITIKFSVKRKFWGICYQHYSGTKLNWADGWMYDVFLYLWEENIVCKSFNVKGPINTNNSLAKILDIKKTLITLIFDIDFEEELLTQQEKILRIENRHVIYWTKNPVVNR